MAAVVVSEDEFRCSICLDLFSNPVTTPCGHNFCKKCITVNWDLNYPHECPLCKERFSSKLILNTNTLVSEMVAKIRSCQKARAGPGDISCDVCPEPKLKALKSCLDCEASYCQNHLEPHLTVSGLKSHELIEPVQNLQDRICSKHATKRYCRTLQGYICDMCQLLDLEKQKVVSLKEEWEQRSSSLNDAGIKSRHMVEWRRLRIQMLQRDLKLAVMVADRAQEHKKQIQKHVQCLIQQLEQEICELDFPEPDSPLRFTDSPGVLGKQSFSQRSFYFEVQVDGKSKWFVGVALESVTRKVPVTLNPNSGYWSIVRREGRKYYACPGDLLNLRSAPQKIRVFVDYKEGLISFYDVDTADLIHGFTDCCFTQKVLPFCGPGLTMEAQTLLLWRSLQRRVWDTKEADL